jgi:tetratricopeptide (TPR) repeat protein
LALKARLLLDAGDLPNAMTTARAAIVADPNALDARLALSESLEKAGKREEAFAENMPHSGNGTRETGTSPVRWPAWPWRSARADEAQQLAREAVRLNPADRRAAIVLTSAQGSHGKTFSAAERSLETLLAGSAGDASLIVLQAAIQAGRGDTAAARASYLRALQANRDSIEALFGAVRT